MALVKCDECGQQVSERARCCPHCGATRVAKRQVLLAVILAALVALGVVLLRMAA
jgi:RNA polymerase subunit RPABC4/transcription elongation factor Spt4